MECNATKRDGLLGTGVEYCGMESNGLKCGGIDGSECALSKWLSVHVSVQLCVFV